MANKKVAVDTSEGKFTIELYSDLMPKTTGNFEKLVKEKFYDGIIFHRIIPGFMIQGGDPDGTGAGGPGYTIKDEFVKNKKLSNIKGTLSMANTGRPNSGGSQFFINTEDNTYLDFDKEPLTSKHPVFGKVIDGMDVIEKISKLGSRPGEPKEPVQIKTMKMKK